MATLTIRDIDEHLQTMLRLRAADNGRSVEAEVRAILRAALDQRSPASGFGTSVEVGVGTSIGRRFASIGGYELDAPERAGNPRSPERTP